MFVLASAAGSFEMSAINAASGGMLAPLMSGASLTTVTAGAMLLFLGCSGKSAQLPLYVWLPDAMAGPTPVSALIHAATMVTAGVYLCCRLSSVFLASPTTLAVIAVVGAATAIIGATSALVQNDLKKILAYSTVSQLGFMFAAVGVGAFTAGIFHVVTHAFFKACLFLGAGSIMHAVHAHGDADVRFLGGLGDRLPKTRLTFGLSVLAIAGVPPLAGFFSKDEILAGAARTALYAGETQPVLAAIAWGVLAVLGLAAILTAFYMARVYALVFRGDYRGAGHYADEPHESEPVLTVPLAILAFGAVVVGFIGLPHWLAPNLLEHALAGTVENLEFEHATNLPSFIALGVGLFAAGVGLFAAHAAYPGDAPDPLPTKLPGALYRFLFDTWRVDGLYERIFVTPMRAFAAFVAEIDRTFIDTLLVTIPSFVVAQKAKLAVRMQDGIVHTYALAMAIGVAGLVSFYAYPHIDITAVANGNDVTLTTPPGLGYRFAWDTNGDGEVDAPMAAGQNSVHVEYEPSDFVGVELITITEPRGYESSFRLGRTPRELTGADLGMQGLTPREGAAAEQFPYRPVAYVRGGKLHIRPNGERVEISNRRVAPGEDEVVADPGARVLIGRTLVLVVPVVRVVIEVETVLGQRVRRTVEVPLRDESTRQDVPIANRAPAAEVTP
jgi:NADH-quinone oxidoreductase subunit L